MISSVNPSSRFSWRLNQCRWTRRPPYSRWAHWWRKSLRSVFDHVKESHHHSSKSHLLMKTKFIPEFVWIRFVQEKRRYPLLLTNSMFTALFDRLYRQSCHWHLSTSHRLLRSLMPALAFHAYQVFTGCSATRPFHALAIVNVLIIIYSYLDSNLKQLTF
jgi:hypothetical protein